MRISDGSSDVCSSDLLSHLNYSGRGKRSSKADAHHQMTRDAMRQLFEQAWDDVQHGRETDFVSGNNDADAVLLLQWVEERLPEHRDRLEGMLRAWGGTASGSGIANIDTIETGRAPRRERVCQYV